MVVFGKLRLLSELCDVPKGGLDIGQVPKCVIEHVLNLSTREAGVLVRLKSKDRKLVRG